MRATIRSSLAFGAFLLASLWLTAPATAWKVHAIEHLSSPVSVSQHHHHAEGEAPDDDRGAPSDQNGPGHSHHLSGAASLTATLEAGSEFAPHPSSALRPSGSVTPTLHELRRPPPSEPPRAG